MVYIQFLRQIYGGFDHDGVFTLIAMQKHNEDGSERGSRLIKVFKLLIREIPTYDWESILAMNEQKWDIYFGAAIRSDAILDGPESSRGGASDCVKSTALAIDIDMVQAGAHVSEKLPSNLEEVSLIIDAGPEPSMVIHSGHGYHVWWLYKEPVLLRDKKDRNQYSRYRKKCHKKYVDFMGAKGWACDTTHTVDRIWRIPGFKNWKLPFKPAVVTAIYGLDSDLKYDLGPLLGEEEKPTTTKSKLPKTPREKLATATNIESLQQALQKYVERTHSGAMVASVSNDPEQLETVEGLAMRSYYISQLLAGESIEEKGNRDQALTVVCGIICRVTQEIQEFSEEDLEHIVVGVMGPSLQKWCDDNEDTDVEREMGKAIDKLRRIKLKDLEDKYDKLDGLRAAFASFSADQKAPREVLTEDGSVVELDEGLKREPTKDELLKSGIIAYKGFLWIWDWLNNAYYPREIKDKSTELRLILRECWPEDGTCPFVHSIVNAEGQTVDLPLDHILKNYGSAARDCYFTFIEEQTKFYPEKKVLTVTPKPWRFRDPEYNPKIDEWLKLLGGDNYELLCDWLAGTILLRKPCACLYLDGPPGCGKTLLAVGAAQLWSDIPSHYENTVGNFNEALRNAPIVLIDEGFINSPVKNPTALLRRLVATKSHSVNEKYGAKLRLDGYIRIIVAANNDTVLLSGKEERLTENDIQAMRERIAYVKIRGGEAKAFFAKYNKGEALTKQWLEGGGFARHILWLAQTRTFKESGRFLVEGGDSDMHNQMIFQGNERNEVLEWLCRFAEAPKNLNGRMGKDKPRAADIGNGIVVVNTKLAKDNWAEFSQSKDILPHSHLLRHLKALSKHERAIVVRVGDKTMRYWVIPIDRVISYADSHDIGDMSTILSNASLPSEITEKVVSSKSYSNKENGEEE